MAYMPENGDNAEENSLSMSIKINGEIFNVTLEDNDAAHALKEILPLELNMNELNGNEKYFYLENDLPTDSVNVWQIHAGDLMLYGSDCIVLFYKDFPTIYRYTRLGTLDNPDGLAEILGDGNVNVTFAVDDSADDDAIDDSADDDAIDDSADDDAIDDSADDDAIDDSVDDAIDDSADDDAIDDSVDDDAIDDSADDDAIDDSVDDDAIDDSADDDAIDDSADDDAIDDSVDDDAIDDSVDDDAIDDSVDDDAIDDSVDDDAIDDSADDDAIDDSADDDAIDDSVDDDIWDIFRIDKWIKPFVNLKPRFKVADASKHKNSLEIIGNALDNLLFGGKGNDTLDGAEGNNTLTGGKGNDLFIFNGGIGFITDYEKKDKINIGSFAYADFSINDKDLILHFDYENSLTIQDGAGKAINLNSEVNYYTDYGILDPKKKSIKLSAGIETFDAKAYSRLEIIDGSATAAIEITGNRKKNYITAGAIGATLSGGKGKDTLVGGAGADVFVYNKGDGKNIIEGYGEGDKINIDSEVIIKDAKIKGGDTVLKFKGGSLTVNGTAEFTFADDTEFRNGVFTAGDTAKVYGSYKGAIDLADNVKNFNGSEGNKKLTITGNAEANEIIGGKKNDKLWGGAGADTFIFQAGNGKDTIMDYSAEQGDLLTILDRKGEAGDFKKATFKNETLTLSIQGGGKVSFSGVESSTEININGNTKTVSELVK